MQCSPPTAKVKNEHYWEIESMQFDPIWLRIYSQCGAGIHGIYIYCIWARVNKKRTLAFRRRKRTVEFVFTSSSLKYTNLHTPGTDLSSETERHVSNHYWTQECSKLSSLFSHPSISEKLCNVSFIQGYSLRFDSNLLDSSSENNERISVYILYSSFTKCVICA